MQCFETWNIHGAVVRIRVALWYLEPYAHCSRNTSVAPVVLANSATGA